MAITVGVVWTLTWLILVSIAFIALIVLRLAGVISWSWWWVLAPLWAIAYAIVTSTVLSVLDLIRHRRPRSRRS